MWNIISLCSPSNVVLHVKSNIMILVVYIIKNLFNVFNFKNMNY